MSEIFEVTTKNGTKVKGRYWPAVSPEYNLNIITGMDEHAARYEPFALFMNDNNVDIHVLDAIGQGLNVSSVEEQQIWPENAFADNVDAIYEMNKMTKANGLPTIQMGHSMGSFMTQSFISRYPETCDKIIIMGSNGGQGMTMKLGCTLAGIFINGKNKDKPSLFFTDLGFGPYVKAVKDRKTDLDWLSYNEENVRKYIDDPWCGHPNTGGFWKEFLRGMSTLWDKATLRNISRNENILIISGADDPVGQMGKGVRWLENKYKNDLHIKNVKMKLYENMRHEILNEDDKMTVYNDILEFIRS